MKTTSKILTLLVIFGFVFFVSCGGGSDSSGTTSGTLSNPPTGLKFTDTSGNEITSWSGATTVELRDGNNNILFSFTPNGNVDFSNVSAERTATKTMVHFSSTSDKIGISGIVTLYAPCTSNQNSIVVCPNAASASEVETNCTDGIALSPTTTSANNYTYANAVTRTSTTDCQVSADIANFSSGAIGNIVLPILVTDDILDTNPCPDQDLLTDATFIADLQAAVDAGPITMYFDGDGATKGPAMCGYENAFAAGHMNFANLTFGGDLNGLIDRGIGVCGGDSNTNSLPKAGVYRHDFRATNDGRTYTYRVRATVTAANPDVTGQTLTSVLGSEDLSTTIEMVDPAGNVIPYDANAPALAASYLPNPINSFTVRKKSDGTALFTIQVELICATQMA